MDWNYLAVILNSSIRSTTPFLYAALGSAICNKSGVFNIALEGQMLISSFISIVVNYSTGNTLLAVLAGVLSGSLVGLIVAVLQVKYEAADMVIGTSLNLLVGAFTAIMLTVIFGMKGSFSSPDLVPLKKIKLPLISKIPFVSVLFQNLTILDYLAVLISIALYVFLFKTVAGFRVISVGINREAAESLGTKAIRTRMLMVILSGALCGLGGAVLSMGQVILFTENMTAGRGFVGMAAANMGQNHPLSIIASSLFFGFAQAIGGSLQNVIPSQLTMAIPYVATIASLAIFGSRNRRRKFVAKTSKTS